jgi:type III secretion protein V
MLRRLQNLVTAGSRYTDILLAVAVVAIIGLMILPLPPAALDVLLACNLGLSTLLLMMAMYIKGILEFSTFPSLLLFTTLLRLSLSITATRLILLHAHAGEVIETFGEFVVGGNLVVGAVIFLIITLVQFLVITKGAERVAEVAARFTLDAMPGKQMSVDADLRAGTIDMETAKLRRTNLERENQLYGAMDGAMKFVKGDAIAGLVITGINIVGGLLIGVLQKGMAPEKALQTYAILTIGDGLVTQIPALLIAITAGMIVTRVSTEDSPALGADIGGQLLGQPKALMLGGSMLLLFALIPGFPKPPFLVLGAAGLAIGYALFRSAGDKARAEADVSSVPAAAPAGQKTPPRKTEAGDEFSLSVPLILDVPASIESTIDSRTLNDELVKVRRALYHDLGVPFPGIHLRFNEGMPDGTYRILLQEIPVAEGSLKAGHVLARDQEDNLNVLGVPFVKERQFLPDVPALWVPASQAPLLKQAGVQTLDPPRILAHHLAAVLKKYAGDFLGLQETRFLLDNMEPRYAEVVKEAQRALPLQRIAEILQRLVQEQISVRNLRTVLQALIEWGQKEKDPVLLAEYVRSSLRRHISYKYSGGQNILAAYLLEPNTEETVRKAIRQTSGGSFLALDPAVAKKLVSNVRKQVGDLNRAGSKPVLLTAMDVRRYVRKLLESELADLPVLSYQELTEEIAIQPLAKISL